MPSIRRSARALLSLALVTSVAGAAEPDTQRIIDGLLAALGGRDAIARLRSLAVEADCTGPDGAFRTRVDSLRPGMTYFEQQAGEGVTRIWTTPEGAWQRQTDGSIETLDIGVRYFLRAHEFHLLLFELESRFSLHRLGGPGSLDGRPCNLIEMVDEAGQPASICMAESDGLPLFLEMNPEGAQGAVRIAFDNWREIGDLRYFFDFRLTEGPDRVFTYRYERVVPDAVSADLFVAPVAAHLRADQDALLEILRQDRRAHLETDAGLVSPHIAETLVEISAGGVNTQTRREVEAFFETMFDSATYQMWEDVEPPVIRFSADATMAWVVRQVRVRRTSPASDGRPETQEFVSAYTSTYEKRQGTHEKRDGQWEMTSVTSTFRGD